MYAEPINKLIELLKKLPSVGQRTAERFVFHWLSSGKKEVNDLRNALEEMLAKVKSCETCWNFSDINPCYICKNTERDHSTICVVSDPQDVPAIEKTGEFSGVYHILRGLIDLSEEQDNLTKIKVKQLLDRLSGVVEVVLALNPDLPGETTAMYLEREIKNRHPKIKVTRLARGLPMGADLQYADEITLGSALKNRH